MSRPYGIEGSHPSQATKLQYSSVFMICYKYSVYQYGSVAQLVRADDFDNMSALEETQEVELP